MRIRSKDLTIVTLSKTLMNRETGPYPYLNYVSTFNDEKGFTVAQHRALAHVETSHCLFVDSDDPVPTFISNNYSNKLDVIYGDFYWIDGEKGKRFPSGNWSGKAHFADRRLVHKPILKTSSALSAIKKLPTDIEIHSQWALYFLIALEGETLYDPSLKIVWIKHPTGLHLQSFHLKDATKQFLLNYYDPLEQSYKDNLRKANLP